MDKQESPVRCQVVPLVDDLFLIPSAAVAEVISFIRPKRDHKFALDGYMGSISWRGLDIPLLSLDTMINPEFQTDFDAHLLIIVLNCDPKVIGHNFLAIITYGAPHMLMAHTETVESIEDDVEEMTTLWKLRVKFKDRDELKEGYLLNLAELEQRFQDGIDR